MASTTWTPRTQVMYMIHTKLKGVPKLKGNAFYKFASCCDGKLCERHVGEYRKMVQDQDQDQNKKNISVDDKANTCLLYTSDAADE